ncbi:MULTISPECIES: lytic transglycosylase domain-containing protein [unclassified Acinetobacter]|uniref:lytic transglycosylase domain-containing protein n=1 Tax=unclassified Acinetobacter TaxID=196816 RepID=UPI0015D12B95|nr:MULTISPECIES: lytic transglycosylase domain-containing protein [unclassified Acinetobacter]
MIDLIQACASNTPVPVAQAIIRTESRFNPHAIGVNYGGKQIKQPKSYAEAVLKAKQLISSGHNIDLGLAQINSSNLKWLGLSIEQVLQPCNNLKAMQFILYDCYKRSGESGLGTKMQRAFSCYNTGNHKKGFNNNYVNKVSANYNRYIGQNGSIYKATYNLSDNQNAIKPLPNNSAELANYANSINGEYNQNNIKNGIAFDSELSNNKPVIERAVVASDNRINNNLSDAFSSPKKDAFSF